MTNKIYHAVVNWFKDFTHNTLVHPLMPFLPDKASIWLHNKSADWAYGLNDAE